MKAVLSRICGGPETLTVEEIARPVAKPDEVLIDVKAIGLNYPDTLIIEDRYQIRPDRPFSPGGEAAGIVAAVGSAVTGFKPGDRVIAWGSHGCMAECVALPAEKCTAMPDEMPFEDASAFLFTYGTSWHALKQRAALRAGETLLILGAAGGVGLAALEIGVALGARVVAAVSSQEKADLVRERGAAEVLIYPRGPFDKEGKKALASQFKAACGAGGADVIYDAVGGDYSEQALRAIAWEGRFLVVGFPAGVASIPLNLPLLKNCQIVGVIWGSWAVREPGAQRRNVAELLKFYRDGKMRPHISEIYPLERAGEAIAQLSGRKALGKILVRI